MNNSTTRSIRKSKSPSSKSTQKKKSMLRKMFNITNKINSIFTGTNKKKEEARIARENELARKRDENAEIDLMEKVEKGLNKRLSSLNETDSQKKKREYAELVEHIRLKNKYLTPNEIKNLMTETQGRYETFKEKMKKGGKNRKTRKTQKNKN